MRKNKKPVIVGAGEFAEIAYEYFTYDSEYEVAAFAVETAFLRQERLFDKPVFDLGALERLYPPDEYETFAAVTYTRLNRAISPIFIILSSMVMLLKSDVSSGFLANLYIFIIIVFTDLARYFVFYSFIQTPHVYIADAI